MERSPFNRLPRELRDIVYNYAVVHDNGISIVLTELDGDHIVVNAAKPSGSPRNASLALAMVCRQFHLETIDLYYARNTFYFPFHETGPLALQTFLHSITDKHRKLLTNLIFEAPHTELDIQAPIPQFPFEDRWHTIFREILWSDPRLLPNPITINGRFTFKLKTKAIYRVDLNLDMNSALDFMEKRHGVFGALQQEVIRHSVQCAFHVLQGHLEEFAQKYNSA